MASVRRAHATVRAAVTLAGHPGNAPAVARASYVDAVLELLR
jgi:hypothetical protein